MRETPTDTVMLEFLLLARYVPNIAKRSRLYEISIRSIYIEDRPTTDQRPTSHVEKKSNGHISAKGRPIHYMFGSTVGFSGSADRMALFSV